MFFGVTEQRFKCITSFSLHMQFMIADLFCFEIKICNAVYGFRIKTDINIFIEICSSDSNKYKSVAWKIRPKNAITPGPVENHGGENKSFSCPEAWRVFNFQSSFIVQKWGVWSNREKPFRIPIDQPKSSNGFTR